MKKKIFIMKNEKKKFGAVKEWATAHCIAKQGLYCKVRSVL